MSTFLRPQTGGRKGIAQFSSAATSGIGANTALAVFGSTISNTSTSIVRLSDTQVQLKAGKSYKIEVMSSFTFSSADTRAVISVRNVTTSTELYPRGVIASSATTAVSVADSACIVVVSPSVDTTIEVRATYLYTGTLNTLTDVGGVTIEELEEFIPQANGSTSIQGDLTVSGFATIGTGGPKIKMKELTGTTAAAEGSNTTVAHGVTGDKIISITGVVRDSINGGIPPAYTREAEYQWDLSYDASLVYVKNSASNSGSILSKPFSICIIYKE